MQLDTPLSYVQVSAPGSSSRQETQMLTVQGCPVSKLVFAGSQGVLTFRIHVFGRLARSSRLHAIALEQSVARDAVGLGVSRS